MKVPINVYKRTLITLLLEIGTGNAESLQPEIRTVVIMTCIYQFVIQFDLFAYFCFTDYANSSHSYLHYYSIQFVYTYSSLQLIVTAGIHLQSNRVQNSCFSTLVKVYYKSLKNHQQEISI